MGNCLHILRIFGCVVACSGKRMIQGGNNRDVGVEGEALGDSTKSRGDCGWEASP